MHLKCLINICQLLFFRVHVHVRMAIPYHTIKFKSANSVKNVVWSKIMTTNISGCTVSPPSTSLLQPLMVDLLS